MQKLKETVEPTFSRKFVAERKGHDRILVWEEEQNAEGGSVMT